MKLNKTPLAWTTVIAVSWMVVVLIGFVLWNLVQDIVRAWSPGGLL